MQALASRANTIVHSTALPGSAVASTDVFLDVPGTMHSWDVQMLVMTARHLTPGTPTTPTDRPDFTITAEIFYNGQSIGPPLNMGALLTFEETSPATFSEVDHSPRIIRQELENPLRMTPRSELKVRFRFTNMPTAGPSETEEMSVALYGEFIPTRGRL